MFEYIHRVKSMNEVQNQLLSATNNRVSPGFPSRVIVTTTLKCNYRCRMCYQASYEGELNWDHMKKVSPILPFVKTLKVFGGEPLLYDRLDEVCNLACENECELFFITNGSLLTDKTCRDLVSQRVAKIEISMDAGTSQTYKHIRGGNFSKVLAGVERIHKLKQVTGSIYPNIAFNFLAMKSNVAELKNLVTIAAKLGVDLINVYYPSVKKDELVDECVYFCQEYSDKELTEANMIAERLGVQMNLPPLFSSPDQTIETVAKRQCQLPWTDMQINVSGSVQLCCYGPTVGNLNDSSFEDIWNSKTAQDFRQRVNTADEPKCCKQCRAVKPKPQDIQMHIIREDLREEAMKRYGIPTQPPSICLSESKTCRL